MSNLEVANTIINQLGGQRFIRMTGSKNFAGYSNGVNFAEHNVYFSSRCVGDSGVY